MYFLDMDRDELPLQAAGVLGETSTENSALPFLNI